MSLGYGFEDFEEAVLGSHPAFVAVLRDVERKAERLAEEARAARRLAREVREKLWGRGWIRRVKEDVGEYSLAAIDSAYPPDGLELVMGKLYAVVAGYVLYRARRSSRVRPHHAVGRIIIVNAERSWLVEAFSKYLEKRVALKLLEHVEDGDLHIDMLVLDGEIVPYPLFYAKKYTEAHEKVLKATLEVLEKAEKLGVSIVGVVKRSYSKHLAAILGRRVEVNDKSVMSLALRSGEYAFLGRYADLMPRALRALGKEEAAKAVEVNVSRAPKIGDVRAYFYRAPAGARSRQAVKIELLDYAGFGEEEIIGFLASRTTSNSVPLFIDVIDSYVRLELPALEYLRRKIQAFISRAVGGEEARLSEHTNLQKKFLAEPPSAE